MINRDDSAVLTYMIHSIHLQGSALSVPVLIGMMDRPLKLYLRRWRPIWPFGHPSRRENPNSYDILVCCVGVSVVSEAHLLEWQTEANACKIATPCELVTDIGGIILGADDGVWYHADGQRQQMQRSWNDS